MASLDDASDLLADTDARVTALEGDIGRCSAMPADRVKAWTDWRTRWRGEATVYTDQLAHAQKAGAVGGLLGAVGQSAAAIAQERVATPIYDSIQRSANELGNWQREVASFKCGITMPGSPGAGVNWQLVAIVGVSLVLVAGVGYAVYRVTSVPAKRALEVAANPRRRRRRRRRG